MRQEALRHPPLKTHSPTSGVYFSTTIEIPSVYFSKYTPSTPQHETTNSVFRGACIDSGASCSIIGKPQLDALYSLLGRKYTLQQARLTLAFGDGTRPSLGTLRLALPTPTGTCLRVDLHVVDNNIPLLLGLDIGRSQRLVLDMHAGTIHSKLEGWTQKLVH